MDTNVQYIGVQCCALSLSAWQCIAEYHYAELQCTAPSLSLSASKVISFYTFSAKSFSTNYNVGAPFILKLIPKKKVWNLPDHRILYIKLF